MDVGRTESFFYNRSVNNIENVRITKVYNQTAAVDHRSNNVSFNGGSGGTAARPTSQQEAVARERHLEATPVQQQNVETASKDRALVSKQITASLWWQLHSVQEYSKVQPFRTDCIRPPPNPKTTYPRPAPRSLDRR